MNQVHMTMSRMNFTPCLVYCLLHRPILTSIKTYGNISLSGQVPVHKAIGRESESHQMQFFPKALLFEKSFICAERQTDRQTDGQTDRQTDKHPQPYSENKPFGKPSVASWQTNWGFLERARMVRSGNVDLVAENWAWGRGKIS